MDLAIEYLAVVDKSSAEAFYRYCDRVEAFIQLLHSEPTIKIANSKLNYKGKFTCNFDLTMSEIKEKEQRFFHITLLSSHTNPDSIEHFVELTRTIKSLV